MDEQIEYWITGKSMYAKLGGRQFGLRLPTTLFEWSSRLEKEDQLMRAAAWLESKLTGQSSIPGMKVKITNYKS